MADNKHRTAILKQKQRLDKRTASAHRFWDTCRRKNPGAVEDKTISTEQPTLQPQEDLIFAFHCNILLMQKQVNKDADIIDLNYF